MVKKITPEINKVYFINQYTLVHVLSGSGDIQVDFKNYTDWDGKVIYLSSGQYIKFLSDTFTVRFIEFPNEDSFNSKDIRVLFKHLITLGYINFEECSECQRYISDAVFNTDVSSILDVSAEQWYWQNPFKANKDEYQVIFDIKEVIDQQYVNNLTNAELAALINENGFNAQALVRNKIGLSVKSLLSNKKLLESQKEIAFTDKNIQEISYDLGYNDPAYFNRVFKNEIGQSPLEFRNTFDYEGRDVFTQDILELLQKYHAQERSLDFYAQKMHLSVKALSKKVRNKMQTTLGKLIRQQLINTARNMLNQGASVNEVAYRLGFEEANHFSSFFKHYTKKSPSEFKQNNS